MGIHMYTFPDFYGKLSKIFCVYENPQRFQLAGYMFLAFWHQVEVSQLTSVL